jgi:molecular chaperone GrpE (heat shock protein)
MKNITLSADEKTIEAARERARSEHTTLNEQFRRWLAEYAHTRERMQRYDEAMAGLRGRLKVGRKLTRDEMNER